MMMRLLRPFLDRWPLVAAVSSALMLAIAHAFETFGGLAPCTLCYRQREVYWTALGVAVAGMVLLRLWRDPRGRTAVCLLLGAIFLYGAGLAAYHAGAEWKWWPGPTTCSGGGGGVSMDAMNDLLAGKTIHGPACDKAAWVFLGLSMAGWNALISLKLTVYSVWAGLRAAKARS